MLKWTSMQKLPEPLTPRILNTTNNNNDKIHQKHSINRKRRATINFTSNKENLITSTPVIKKCNNSPLLLKEFLALTPPPKKIETKCKLLPSSGYASTLPKYSEEYSPNIILPGQMLALRGLLPDSYIGNPRYLSKKNDDDDDESKNLKEKPLKKMLTRNKRKLENDFNKIKNIQQEDNKTLLSSSLNSTTKMGDLTLDKLIDAILDSTRKDNNNKKCKKTPRKSLNLRRRTLLKNSSNINLILSPSYKPADDPCSDLNFSELKNIPKSIDIDHKQENVSCGKRKLLSSSLDDEKIISSNSKKSKTTRRRSSNSSKYFEVGLALPSIYV